MIARRSARRSPSRLSCAALALVLAAAACGAPAAAKQVPAGPRAPDRVQLLIAGIPSDLAEGEEIALGGSLVATLQIKSLPVRSDSRLLALRVTGGGGAPVDDARVQVSAHMRYMDHGSFTVLGSSTGDGRYLATLPFAMAGEWELEISVGTATDSGMVALNFDDVR